MGAQPRLRLDPRGATCAVVKLSRRKVGPTVPGQWSTGLAEAAKRSSDGLSHFAPLVQTAPRCANCLEFGQSSSGRRQRHMDREGARGFGNEPSLI